MYRINTNYQKLPGSYLFSEVARRIRKETDQDVPIIILSTEGQSKDIEAGMSFGANLYMVKPAQPEKMVRNIKMLLG